MLSEAEFTTQYESLIDAFGNYSKNPGRTADVYYESLKNTPWDTLKKTVSHAIKTCKRFPSIAELRDISQQFNPKPSSTNTTITDDVDDFKRRMRICNDITAAIQKLPDFQRRSIENQANQQLQANAPDWYTTEMKRRAFQGFCVITFRSLCPEAAYDIEHNTTQSEPVEQFKPLPFYASTLKTPLSSQPQHVIDMERM